MFVKESLLLNSVFSSITFIFCSAKLQFDKCFFFKDLMISLGNLTCDCMDERTEQYYCTALSSSHWQSKELTQIWLRMRGFGEIYWK